ncbi:TetR family transcriptional regulator C-terminal domain-containing protein [Streptomyces somaliensis DSM 40738]|uniref:TetR family transcriptional regulator n=1 Tax=Streptomyces somaliensis (strain ATCC 33201 / DSM 40738 / JCM 12659 / KCTC 9044 / NCTC 11332 / NRRL B-12077 / IP 733) TaxID=1134445 RepID=A0AA44DAT6_STRE0|nr:TetR family transcriptional regulator C-terminal domain-containing protein [Streptomyces somaliensis]MCQ0022813.1 TetR family transcriptional regulator C-terminal domain-containing protein [Streptomyces somaliensis DSM 40738]NKY12975.1 TetR family transcriptional regulator [Streptomyces somaliensis DSM 40738]
MPKRVDHEERRAEIAEALLRVAARRGLHAVSMRDVAAEAGVSLRLVQYYFETKEKLLLHGLRHLAGRFGERVRARVRAAGPDPGPRAVVVAMLTAALPTDEESRVFHLVYTSYAVLSVTDRALAAQPFVRDPDAAEGALLGLLRRAEEDGLVRPGVDVRVEAVSLLALSAGLGTGVLVGQRDPEGAAAVLDHHLDRIFRDGPAGVGPRG